MIRFIIKKFIKDYQNKQDPQVRNRYITLSGVLGIIINFILFLVKLVIGLTMQSIAIISDSFNNLSDTLNSVIAILAAWFSRKPADKEHPYGHGRFEYIASLTVAFIILLVGVELLKTSVDKILHPTEIIFNLILIIILGLSVLAKLWMYSYNKYIGQQIHSPLNYGLAQDSINDVLATSGVIISALVDYFFHINIDGYAGVIISILVAKAGVSLAKDTINILLGHEPDQSLVDQIRELLLMGRYVRGVHGLTIHDYGRGKILGSVHVEIPMDVSVVEIHSIIDELEHEIHRQTQVELVIHMDPVYNLYGGKESE